MTSCGGSVGVWLGGLCATAILMVNADAAQPARAAVFSDRDYLRVAREVCGAATRASIRDSISSSSGMVNGFLSDDGGTFYSELLSQRLTENGIAKHVVAMGGHFVEDGEMASSEGARTGLCVGWLEHRNGKWQQTAFAAPLAETGFNGRDPEVTVEAIGAQRHALQVTQGLWNAGSGLTMVTLYEPRGRDFSEVLSIATAADDCGGGEPCFRFEGALVYDSASRASSYDLQLWLKGTYRNETGRILRVPAAPLILRQTNGAYAPVSPSASTHALWRAVQEPW